MLLTLIDYAKIFMTLLVPKKIRAIISIIKTPTCCHLIAKQ